MSLRMRIRATILALLAAVVMNGQELTFRHYSDYDGLWRNAIRALAQDKYGYIWIGADAGLKRFDGISMRSFHTSNDKSVQSVYALLDMGDSLLVGTDDGAFVIDYISETTHRLNLTSKKGRQKNIHVTSLAVDKDSNVWISTMGHGIYQYATGSGTIRNIDVCIDNRLAQVFVDSSNQVWALTAWEPRGGVFLYDKATRRFEVYKLNGNWSPGVYCMAETGDGTLWLGTWNNGIVAFDRSGNVKSLALGQGHKDFALHIHSITEYNPGILLVGCDNGLVWYDIKNGASRTYTKTSLTPNSISGSFVYPVLTDNEGGIWIGTFYSGLNYISPTFGRFASFNHKENVNSVKGNVISRFCEDANRNIWIASDDGGLNRYSPSTGEFEHITLGNGDMADNNIHALCMDGNQLWIGTYTAGVYVMDINTRKCRRYKFDKDNNNSLYGNSCYAIFRDSKTNIWLATTEGINIYRRETDDFRRVRKEESTIMDIDEDSKGQIWLASQSNGILRLNPTTGKWRKFKGCNTHSVVNSLCIDESGIIWAATDDGLLRYSPSTDRFDRVELLENTSAFGIIEDNDALWITTNDGLFKYSQDKQIMHFDVNDGLLSNIFIPNAAMKASDGCIYIGTVNGFNTFYPYKIKTNTRVPKVMITSVEVMNQKVNVGDERMKESLNTSARIELSYQDKMITISFASLSYCMPQKNKYSYILEGFDRQWIMAGNNSTATYTNLSPGTYKFRVKGTNNDGVWSTEEAMLEIVVNPPFYWSLPAKILYVIIIVTLIVYAFRYTLTRERRRHEAQMAKLNEEKELEVRNSKIQFFTTIAHEIRTPVSLIIGPLEKLVKTTAPLSDSERSNLRIIDRNANRLLELVNQLLDFSKVENRSMVVRFRVQNICDMLHAVTERFEPTFAQNGITFKIEMPDPHFTAVIDNEAITKVVSNLLTNARKYTRDHVRLSCHVMPDDNSFAIEVEDNGVGVKPEDKERIFNAFYQSADNKPGTGIGLSIVKNIVDQHHGKVSVSSLPGHGSTFTVILPVRQDVEMQLEIASDNHAETDKASFTTTSYPPLSKTFDPIGNSAVLVIDDNDDMLTYLEESISQKYQVITAHDGLEALDKLSANDVSLIICDWMMPRMDGAEFCRRVRSDAATSHIPFVMLTAKTDVDSKVEGMNVGADAYIEKPFSMSYLEACCMNIMNMRRMLREKYSSNPSEPITEIASSNIDKDFLERMQRIIEENFSNADLNVNFLADKMCISRSRLFAKIKTLADVSPNEMIQIVRLKKAAQLLAEGNMKVSEVCYTVGFNNPSYFSKCFYKQFGVRPTEVKN